MALQPKLTVLVQDLEDYAYVTVQDTTGVYNGTTNPGGYGSPNPASGDVLKAMLRAEYMGASTVPAADAISVANVQGAGVLWSNTFQEGVTKILYMVGLAIGGTIEALEGNLQFTLNNANTVLAGASYIELDGDLYQINQSLGLTSSGGYVMTPFAKDYLTPVKYQYIIGETYTLWKQKGYNALITDIGNVACTSLECGSMDIDQLMARYRFHLAIQPNFEKSNYSKAHNLAVALAPETTVSGPCITC